MDCVALQNIFIHAFNSNHTKNYGLFNQAYFNHSLIFPRRKRKANKTNIGKRMQYIQKTSKPQPDIEPDQNLRAETADREDTLNISKKRYTHASEGRKSGRHDIKNYPGNHANNSTLSVEVNQPLHCMPDRKRINRKRQHVESSPTVQLETGQNNETKPHLSRNGRQRKKNQDGTRNQRQETI